MGAIMKRYHITCSPPRPSPADLDEAIRIAIDQISRWLQPTQRSKKRRSKTMQKNESTDQQSLEDRKLNTTLAVLFMGLETADDPETAYKEIMQAVADAGKDPMYVMDWLVSLGRGR
jgi:hypothetical protein